MCDGNLDRHECARPAEFRVRRQLAQEEATLASGSGWPTLPNGASPGLTVISPGSTRGDVPPRGVPAGVRTGFGGSGPIMTRVWRKARSATIRALPEARHIAAFAPHRRLPVTSRSDPARDACASSHKRCTSSPEAAPRCGRDRSADRRAGTAATSRVPERPQASSSRQHQLNWGTLQAIHHLHPLPRREC